jgi:hypothetical protein
MKNVLQFKCQEEVINYLNTLSQEELKQEFNIIDNLYSKLYHFLYSIVLEIFTKYYDKPLDDICFNKIENYEKYIEEYLIDFSKYIDSISKDLKEFVFCVNKEKLMINSKSYLLKEDNSNIKEVIIEIYGKIINDDYNGTYNQLVLLVNKLKRHIECYNYLKSEKRNYLSSFSEFFENINRLSYNRESLEIIVNDALKITEIISEEIILRKHDFKTLLSKENYEILEKYNLINKLAIILYSPIIGIDMVDLSNAFKGKKISKIIDNNIEREFNKTEENTNIIYLLGSKREDVLSIIYDKINQLERKYNNKNNDDFYQISGLIIGEEREIIIVIGE